MSLKILIATNMYPRPNKPSYGAFVKQQVDGLRSAGHRIDVVDIDGTRNKFTYITGGIEVFFKTLRTRYDAVHAHYGLSALLSMWAWKTPVVLTLHGSDALAGWFQPMISKWFGKRVAAVICVAPNIQKLIPGTVIPCGVDTQVFKPMNRAEARKQLGLKPDSKYIVFPFDPGRQVKRYDIAEATFNILKNRYPGKVEFLTVHGVANTLMPVYYSAADVMLLASDSEGSPTSVKEVLACNTPVVTTDVGDVREILKDIQGVHICRQNLSDLALGLEKVLFTEHRADFDGRSFMKKYEQTEIIKALENVYRGVKK